MATFEVLSQPNTEQSEESSEFIIFPNPSLSIDHINDSFNMVTLQSAVMSATPDLSPEEVHRWLKELLQENIEMKEALQKNNAVMHEQLSTVAAWHERMEQTNSKHRIMLEEATQFGQKVQSEKQELLQKINQMENMLKASPESQPCSQCNALEEKITSLNQTITDLVSEKEKLTPELNNQRGMQKQLENRMQSISEELDDLQFANKILVDEKQELTAINNDLNTQLSMLNIQRERKENNPTVTSDDENGYIVVDHPKERHEKIGDSLKDTLLQLHHEQTKVMQLTQKLEEERMEVACLKNLLEDQEDQINTLSKMGEVPKKPESESCSFILCSSCQGEKGSIQQRTSYDAQESLAMASCLQKYKKNCSSLQQCVLEYQTKMGQLQTSAAVEMGQLRQEIQNLKEVAKQDQLANEQEKNNLLETKQTLEQLSIDYKKSVKQLSAYQQDEKTKKEQLTTMKEIEQRQHYEQLDMLTAKFLQVEQQFEAEQQKVVNLKAELSTLKQDSENIPILKAQVELYKTDFEAEKASREHFEKGVHNLNKELKKLKNEMESKPDSQSVFLSSNGKHHKDSTLEKITLRAKNIREFQRHDNSSVLKADESVLLSCPRCMLGFTELQSLENHVEACLLESSTGFL